jgi:spore germination protein
MIEKDDIKGIRDIKDKILTVTDIREEKDLSKAINSVLSGDTILSIETMASCFVIASRLWPVRSISEPSGETVVRGGRGWLH